MAYDLCVWYQKKTDNSLPKDIFSRIMQENYSSLEPVRIRIYEFLQLLNAEFPQNDDLENDSVPVWADDFQISDGSVYMTCLYPEVPEVLLSVKRASQAAGLIFYDPQTGELSDSSEIKVFSQVDNLIVDEFFEKINCWHRFTASDLGKSFFSINTGNAINDIKEQIKLIEFSACNGDGASQRVLGFCYFFLANHEKDDLVRKNLYKKSFENLVKSLDKVFGQKVLLKELKIRAALDGIILM